MITNYEHTCFNDLNCTCDKCNRAIDRLLTDMEKLPDINGLDNDNICTCNGVRIADTPCMECRNRRLQGGNADNR